jgi:hypothetical protein
MLRRLLALPAAAGLLALSVSAASAATGTTWTIVPVPDVNGVAAAPLSISCPSPSDCVTVGDEKPTIGNAFPVAESWNGSAWTVMTVAEPAHTDGGALESVSCVSADYCMAVGVYEATDTRHNSQTLTEVWNGSTWTIKPGAVKKIGLGSVSCVSATYCVAQGEGDIEVWNGSTWSEAASDPAASKDLGQISCPTMAGCYITDSGYVAYWDGGTSLTQQSLAAPPGGNFYEGESISCTGAQSCTVVGDNNGGPLAEAWNGTVWTIEPTHVPAKTVYSNLAAVSCVSAASCTAVGTKDPAQQEVTDLLAERWNGSGDWGVANLAEPGDDGGQFLSISCTTTVNCMAMGEYFSLSTEEWSTLAYELQPSS